MHATPSSVQQQQQQQQPGLPLLQAQQRPGSPMDVNMAAAPPAVEPSRDTRTRVGPQAANVAAMQLAGHASLFQLGELPDLYDQWRRDTSAGGRLEQQQQQWQAQGQEQIQKAQQSLGQLGQQQPVQQQAAVVPTIGLHAQQPQHGQVYQQQLPTVSTQGPTMAASWGQQRQRQQPTSAASGVATGQGIWPIGQDAAQQDPSAFQARPMQQLPAQWAQLPGPARQVDQQQPLPPPLFHGHDPAQFASLQAAQLSEQHMLLAHQQALQQMQQPGGWSMSGWKPDPDASQLPPYDHQWQQQQQQQQRLDPWFLPAPIRLTRSQHHHHHHHHLQQQPQQQQQQAGAGDADELMEQQAAHHVSPSRRRRRRRVARGAQQDSASEPSSPEADSWAAGGGSSPLARRPGSGGLPGEAHVCQVPGCGRDLSRSKDYHQRHRICEQHFKAPQVS
jgi:hypothetical protein